MREFLPPFKYRLTPVFDRIKKLPVTVDGISLSLPFFSVSVKVQDVEQRVAREIVIRMADRRVLNASECCDSCIRGALASLQEIRRMLVDRQADLADHTEGPLYLMIELMLEGIRQFQSFDETIRARRDRRESYRAALESLRHHLHRSLVQVAALAGVRIPKIPTHMRYDAWMLESYELDGGSSPGGSPAAPLIGEKANPHRRGLVPPSSNREGA